VLVFANALRDVKEGLLPNALIAEWPSYAAYAISHLHAGRASLPPNLHAARLDRLLDRPRLYPLATLLGLANFRLSLAIYASITLFYLVLPLSP
jgi:hypothetical protein